MTNPRRDRGGAPTIHVSAPGKVFWSGEYAVLDGAPALVMAVNRRAQVTFVGAATTAPASGQKECLRTPVWRAGSDLSTADPIEFSPDAEPDAPTARFAWAATRALADQGYALPPAGTLTASTSGMRDGSRKLGIGSSAAGIVATVHALATAGGIAPHRLPWSVYLRAHDLLQGQGGSGADLAASRLGGLLRFRRCSPIDAEATALGTPPVHYALLWTGQSASTSSFIAQFRPWAARPEAAPLLRDLHAGATAASAMNNGASMFAALGAYRDLLKALGIAIGAPIYSDAHQCLDALAASYDVVYKPSGAGGGDLGIAVALDADELQRFTSGAKSAGFPTVPLECDPHGATIEPA